MPRKPAYDPEPLNRFRYNSAAVKEVTQRIYEEAVHPLAGDLTAEHDITEEVAALWLAHQVKHLLEEHRTFRAAWAHSGGLPLVWASEVLGWRGGASSVTRRMPDLDELVVRISQAQQEADRTGQPQTITLDSGHIETIHPRH